MGVFPNRRHGEERKAVSPVAARMRLQFMNNLVVAPSRTAKTATGADNTGWLVVLWDSRHRLRFACGADHFRALKPRGVAVTVPGQEG